MMDSKKINEMIAAANGTNHVGEYPDGKYCTMPNTVGTVHAVADLCEILELRQHSAELAAQVKQLQNDLRQQKLIHIGFTNDAQVHYVTEEKEEGMFFPNSENECYIPVYMLDIHRRRTESRMADHVAVTYEQCLAARDADTAEKYYYMGWEHSLSTKAEDGDHYGCGKRLAKEFANQLRQEAKGDING